MKPFAPLGIGELELGPVGGGLVWYHEAFIHAQVLVKLLRRAWPHAERGGHRGLPALCIRMGHMFCGTGSPSFRLSHHGWEALLRAFMNSV